MDYLTPEQEASLPQYVEKWLKIGKNTDPCNFEESIKGALEVYDVLKLPRPTNFYMVDCPLSCAYLAAAMAERYAKNPKDYLIGKPGYISTEQLEALINVKSIPVDKVRSHLENQIFGNQESWIGFYDWLNNETDIKCPEIAGLIRIAENCGWWSAYNETVIFQHRPLEIHFDPDNRLHALGKPALKFRGGWTEVYMHKGMVIKKDIALKNFKGVDIDKESNLELRRVMMEIYGTAPYLLETGAEEVHRDDWGTLYKKKQPEGEETLMMVKVIDATPEPDGTYKEYFIRVDPNAYGGLKTALDAVASTWREPDGSMVFPSGEAYAKCITKET